MRVLATAMPLESHIWDVVPLAWALVSAGHQVRLASLPNAMWAVRETGLPALLVGQEVDFGHLNSESGPAVGAGPHAEFAHRAARVSGLLAQGLLDGLGAFRPDLVLYEPMDMAGALVAQHLGVPSVHVGCGPPYPDAQLRAYLAAAAGLRRSLGMPARVCAPALVIDVCPPSFRPPGGYPAAPRQAMRFVPYNGPGRVPGWLREPRGGRRVCVTMGTATDPEGLRLAARIAAVIRGLGRDIEIIVPLQDHDMAAVPGGPGIRVVEWFPLKVLFAAGCDLVVHHGGPGTALTAMSFGVPQLTVNVPSNPAAREHLLNSRLIDRSGAGRSLTGASKPDDAIAESALALLTDPAYRLAARAVAAEMAAQPSPAEAAAVVERVAGA